MARHLHIRCVVKTERTSAHERIRAIGGVSPDGSQWTLTQDQAISQIEDGKCVFYIEKPGGQRVDMIVAMDAHANKYLKTAPTRTNRITFYICLPVLKSAHRGGPDYLPI